MQNRVMVAGLILLSLAVATSAQDTPTRGKSPAPAKIASSSPQALAILDAAIKHQGPEKYAKDGAIKDFTLRISSEIWDHTVSPPRKISVDVLRILALAPEEKFRTEWRTTAGIQIRGFTGKRYWYTEYDHNGSTPFGSAIGGFVYRGSRMSEFYGTYLFHDFVAGKLIAMDPTTGELELVELDPNGAQLSGFGEITWGEDEAGELYIGRGNGQLLKLSSTLKQVPLLPGLARGVLGIGLLLGVIAGLARRDLA